MALFSPSESEYFTTFLAGVDLDASITPDGAVVPGVADRVPHLQGSEALSKATQDLMSLDVPVFSSSSSSSQSSVHVHEHPDFGGRPNYWPSIPTTDSASSLSSAAALNKLGSTSSLRSSSPASYLARGLSSSLVSSDSARSLSQLERSSSTSSSLFAAHLASQPHLQIAPIRPPPSSSSSSYALPPITTAGFQNGTGAGTHDGSVRPSAIPSPASAPSVPSSTTAPSSTSAKRSLPSSSHPSAAKRRRSSPSGSSFPPAHANAEHESKQARRAPSSAPSNASANANGNGTGTGTGGGSGTKGALLSPSQKRANHIQSEQKRRANIRRGYEALCEVVPALREAIRVEDERERELAAADAPGAGGKDKGNKKKKGRAEGGAGDKPDGRAGPRSENVVLQKTIDYITALIDERTALQQRLELARGVLPLGHPALPVEPRHLDGAGRPMWEREWNGGMDLDLTGGAGDDDGSEDEG